MDIKITDWVRNTITEMIEDEGWINAEAILQDIIEQGVVDEEYVDIISPAPDFEYNEAADLLVQEALIVEIKRQLKELTGN